MAYRNHPTRYLIVKDRVALPPLPAVSRKRQPTLRTVPRQALFFKTRRLVCRRPRFRFPEAEGVSTLPRQARQALFFQSPFRPVGRLGRAAVSPRGGSFYARPPGPSTLFFTQPEEPLSLGPRRRFPSARRSVSTLAHPTRQRFFSIPPRFLATPARARRGFPQRERLSTRGRGERQRFSDRRGVFPRAPPRR